MRTIAAASLEVPLVLIKASRSGIKFLRVHSKMPFSKHCCAITHLLEALRKEADVGAWSPRRVPVDDASLRANAMVVHARHERRPRGRAEGVGVVVLQDDPSRRESIDVRRKQATCAVLEAHFVPAKIICDNEHDIGGWDGAMSAHKNE